MCPSLLPWKLRFSLKLPPSLPPPGCGVSTYTLDSGIGTFPLPDYTGCAAGINIPEARLRGERDSHEKQGPTTKVPHKAQSLDRQLTSLAEDCPNQGSPNSTAVNGSTPEHKASNSSPPIAIHAGKDYIMLYVGRVHFRTQKTEQT